MVYVLEYTFILLNICDCSIYLEYLLEFKFPDHCSRGSDFSGLRDAQVSAILMSTQVMYFFFTFESIYLIIVTKSSHMTYLKNQPKKRNDILI